MKCILNIKRCGSTVFFIFCSLLFLPNRINAQTTKRPNVLFIIADDLTATAVSSYENKTKIKYCLK